MFDAILNFAKSSARSPKAPAPAASTSIASEAPAAAGLFLNLEPAAAYVFRERPELKKQIEAGVKAKILPAQRRHNEWQLKREAGSYFAQKNAWKNEVIRAAIAGKEVVVGDSLEERLLKGQMDRRISRISQCRNSDSVRPDAHQLNSLFLQGASEVAAEREAKERQEAADLGLPFEPSGILKALQQVAWRAHERQGMAGTPTPPASMLVFDLRLLGIEV